MPNLANIISVTRCKIYLVLKGIKVIRIYMAKLVELAKQENICPVVKSFFFLSPLFFILVLLLCYIAFSTQDEC